MSTYPIDPGKLRAARGSLRKEAVAVKVGRSFSTITAYERGKSSLSVESLFALADLYGVTVDELRADPPAAEAVAS